MVSNIIINVKNVSHNNCKPLADVIHHQSSSY